MIRRLDRRLRRRLGLFELCDDPDMLFRVRIVRAAHALPVPGGSIPAGAKVLDLHLWNEHLPTLPHEGPNIEWGLRASRMLVHSCRMLVRHMGEDERLAEVAAICGSTVLFSPGDRSGGERVFERMGFNADRARSRLGGLGEFWGNLHAWMVMWAFNAATLRHHRLLRMRRTEFWATAEDFARKHGSPTPGRRADPGLESRRGRRSNVGASGSGVSKEGARMAATEQEMVQAFQAIDEEASRLLRDDLPSELKTGLAVIVKIARHRKDMRRSAPGSCKSERAG